MPEFLRLISELREHMQAELTRSDVLRPLVWPILALILALAVLSGRVPPWVITWLSIILAGLVCIYVITYGVCFVIDRDALRSEKYKLQKMAIERGIYGDNTTGVLETETPIKLTGPSATAAEDADE